MRWRFGHGLGDGAADPFVAEEGSNEPCRGLHETAGMVRAAEQQPQLPPLFVGHTVPGPFVQVQGGREKSGREVRLLDVAPRPRSPGTALGLPFQERIGLVGQRHLIDLVGHLSDPSRGHVECLKTGLQCSPIVDEVPAVEILDRMLVNFHPRIRTG